MEDPGYAYLLCDLLDKAVLTTIILRVKLLYIKMLEQHLQNFNIESKSKKGFEKSDMHVVMPIESTTIVSSTPAFQPKLILMFFHMDSIR